MNNNSNFTLIPIIAIFPCIVYTLMYFFGIHQPYAICTALLLTLVGDQINRRVLKVNIYNKIFGLIMLSLTVTLLSWFFTQDYISNHHFCFIVFEITTLLLFMILRSSRTLIKVRYLRKCNIGQKLLFHGFVQLISLINYFFILHISVIIIYLYFRNAGAIENQYVWDLFIFRFIPLVAMLAASAYEIWRVVSLYKKLNNEEWIPIVSETGDITGKIAKSVSLNMKDKYMHPVVRIALICGEKVFIQERPLNDKIFPGKLDYPFEKYVLYGHVMRESVVNSIKKNLAQNVSMDINYVLKYPYENEDTKRLVFFYTASIQNESDIKRTKKMSGKFWTIKQIEEVFADGSFSEHFELEFEYLKNMILLKDENCLFCKS